MYKMYIGYEVIGQHPGECEDIIISESYHDAVKYLQDFWIDRDCQILNMKIMSITEHLDAFIVSGSTLAMPQTESHHP